jgi:rhodanese-related sulfurtransferase
MTKILLLAGLLGTSLFADFKTVDVNAFSKLMAKGYTTIDIRTPGEWKQTGIIKGAHKMMFFTPKGNADLAEWFFNLGRLVKDKKQPILIYCAHANRSKSLGQGLINMGFENVYELKGGIENGWIKAGKKTVK